MPNKLTIEDAIRFLEDESKQGQIPPDIANRLLAIAQSALAQSTPASEIVKYLLTIFTKDQITELPLSQIGLVLKLREFLDNDNSTLSVISSSTRTYIFWKKLGLLYILKISDKSFIIQMTLVEAKKFLSFDRNSQSVFIEIDKIPPVKRISKPSKYSAEQYIILAINNFYNYVTS